MTMTTAWWSRRLSSDGLWCVQAGTGPSRLTLRVSKSRARGVRRRRRWGEQRLGAGGVQRCEADLVDQENVVAQQLVETRPTLPIRVASDSYAGRARSTRHECVTRPHKPSALSPGTPGGASPPTSTVSTRSPGAAGVVRVTFMVTNVSPPAGDSWLKKMPFVACRP